MSNFNIVIKAFLAGIVVTLATLDASQCHADIINGDFEAGSLRGWNSIGSSASVNWPVLGIEPSSGAFFGVIENSIDLVIPIPTENLELFLGLSPGTLQKLDDAVITQGSAIKQSIFVNEGDVLKFSVAFATNNTFLDDEFYDDFGFFSVSSENALVRVIDVTSAQRITSKEFVRVSSFVDYSHTFHSSGVVEIAFGTVDVEDTFVRSAMIVDNVELIPASAIPEPTNLIGIGLLSLAIMLWKSRSNIATFGKN
jgi:hypothetical protein